MTVSVFWSASKTEFNPWGSHGGSPKYVPADFAGELRASFACPSPEIRSIQCPARPAGFSHLDKHATIIFIARRGRRIWRIIFEVARKAKLLQYQRLLQGVGRNRVMHFHMVMRLACGNFKVCPQLGSLQPTPVLQPHVDGDVINRRRFVRCDENLRFLQTAPYTFAAGANKMVFVLPRE